MIKTESEFKYLIIGVADYLSITNEENNVGESNILPITLFALYLATYELDYSYCSNKECKCNSRQKIKNLLKNEIILNYVRFADFYYGDGKSIMLKMKELGWIEKGENL